MLFIFHFENSFPYLLLLSPREAIECYKRALLGSEATSTSISTRLAKLYDEIEDTHSAASYHQQIIDVSLLESRPVHAFAKSLLYVARYHVDRGGGDVKRALAYVEKVAGSNAEEVGAASEMLRRMVGVKVEEEEKGLGDGEVDGKVEVQPPGETGSSAEGEVPPGTAR